MSLIAMFKELLSVGVVTDKLNKFYDEGYQEGKRVGMAAGEVKGFAKGMQEGKKAVQNALLEFVKNDFTLALKGKLKEHKHIPNFVDVSEPREC
jgi:predicted transposase YdaD